MKSYSSRWIHVALAYFVVAVAMGIYMGASGDHSLRPVHVHMNLLGWVSLALIGIIYHYFPNAGTNKLASTQFWLYNLALAPMMLCLGMMLKGYPGVEPVMGLLSMIVGVSVLLFAVNIYTHRGRSETGLLH